jgi:hypothetical protein
MTPSSAEVIAVKVLVVDVRHGACAKAIGVISAETSNATTAKATQVSSTKATNLASAKATHVASAEAAPAATMSSAATKAAHATTVSSAAATAPGLCTGRKQAASERCARQNCYHSSFHETLHLDGRIFRHRSLSDVGVSRQSEHQSRDRMEMRMLSRRLH